VSALDEEATEMFGRPFTLERPGCQIHYWLAGAPDAPLVTLSHAALTDHSFFAALMPAPVPHYRVLTWDIRGHGSSRPLAGPFTIPDAVADLAAILDSLRVSRAVMAGQSMGTYVGQEMTFRHPDRCFSPRPPDLAEGRLGGGFRLTRLGEFRLGDLAKPELIYQLTHAGLPTDFTPIRTAAGRGRWTHLAGRAGAGDGKLAGTLTQPGCDGDADRPGRGRQDPADTGRGPTSARQSPQWALPRQPASSPRARGR